MTESKKKRKRRIRSLRRTRIIMMAIGGAVLVLGVSLLIAYYVMRNVKILNLAILYLVGGGLVLIARSALVAVDGYRKGKYKKR